MNPIPKRTIPFVAALLLGLTFTAASQSQPFTLPASAAGAGATEATGGSFSLRGTVGQAAGGSVAGGAYTVGEGFWPTVAASSASGPLVTFILTPTNPVPPVSVPRGGSFTFDATTMIAPGGPTQLDYWAKVRLPNGVLYGPNVFGPVTLNLPPGGGTAPLTQTVVNAAPLGTYWYIMRVGTFPDDVAATDSFQVTVVPSAVQDPDALAATGKTGGSMARRISGAALSASAPDRRTAEATERWLAFTDGVLLEPGMVLDLRAGALVVAEAEGAPEGEADGSESATQEAASSESAALPEVFALHAAYPNPFATTATLGFDLPQDSDVRMAVYDVLGRVVTVLHDGPMEAGSHRATLRAAGLSSGTYVVRMTTDGGFAQTQRLTLLR